VEKYCRAGQATDDNMLYTHCMLDTKGYKLTHSLCNAYCFSTATVVAQMHLSVTLLVHCMSVCLSHQLSLCHVQTCTRVGTLIVATIYLQLIQNRYMFRSFTVLQCSHQHCVQPVVSDVEVVGYL